MWRLGRLVLPRAPTPFKFTGSPVKLRGPGHEISASYVLTKTFNGEPMKVHCIPGYVSALYLAEYPERQQFLLLDCGCPSDYMRVKFYIEDVLSKAGGNLLTMKKNLRLAVSTHCHLDHCGAATGYIEEHVPVARATHMESSYQGFRRRVNQWFECLLVIFVGLRLGRRPENTFWYARSMAGPYYPMPPPLRELAHGDTLPFGFEDWAVVKIPGHTTHMIALYHTPSRMLYTSDLLVKLRKGFFAPTPIDYDWAFSNTLHRVRRLDVGYLLMSHGGIVDVEDQFGSWGAILDEVVDHYRADTARKAERKKGSSMGGVVVGMVDATLISCPDEARVFTRADLDSGPMPQPSPEPAQVIILDR